MMKKAKNKGGYQPNPSGHYNIDIIIRGIKCNVTIINDAYNKFRFEVKSKKTLSQEFLDYIGEYFEQEGFSEEARKHNLEWNQYGK
jgi:hypothetical protein